MQNEPVYSFGEKGEDQWYAHEDGVRIKCDEKIIDLLWWQWIMNAGVNRADKDGYAIFESKQVPMSLDCPAPIIDNQLP